jgi:hypothetical protein
MARRARIDVPPVPQPAPNLASEIAELRARLSVAEGEIDGLLATPSLPAPAPVPAPTRPVTLFVAAPWVLMVLGLLGVVVPILVQTLRSLPQSPGIVIAGLVLTGLGSILVAVDQYLQVQAQQAADQRAHEVRMVQLRAPTFTPSPLHQAAGLA